MALQIFNIVDNQDMVNLKVRLINEGWSIYLLPTPIIDKASFFQAIRSVFILDPPVSDNWDALSDSLWEGIFSHHSDIAIAIIWENSDMMANNDRKNFDIAVDVLNFLAKSINEWPRKDKVDKKVIIVLGSGAN